MLNSDDQVYHLSQARVDLPNISEFLFDIAQY